MDEYSKEIIGAVSQQLAPSFVRVIDDLIGILGGDQLSAFREKRRKARLANVQKEAFKILEERGVDQPAAPNEAVVIELLEAAQDEPREELRDIWARLLAAMFDPARAPSFRREFIAIVKQMEPLDAAILPILEPQSPYAPSRVEFVAIKLQISRDEVEVSFRNLLRLELVWQQQPGHVSQVQPYTTALGRRLLFAVK